MGSTVLECFPKLLKDNVNERIDGGLKLLQHMSKEVQENGESKELNHILNRLVRGLGSSKVASRKGFYSTLTVYLSLNPDIKIDRIFSIMDIELKTSTSSTKSEFGDINNGRILACGAIIRSQLLKTGSVGEQKRVLECLIHSGKQRSYLSFESVSFIIEFLNLFEDKESFAPIWPLLEQEICKPFADQSLDTFYALLKVQDKFPDIISKKAIKRLFNNESIINEESMKDIIRILTEIPRIICHKHPVYEIFCEKLIETEFVEQFWTGIDQCFIKPSKTDEYLGVELFKMLLQKISNKSLIPILLSPNFLKYMIQRYRNNAKHKTDDVAAGFRRALSQLVTVLDKEVKTKIHISVLKKLILYPGDLLIEKVTGTRVIQMITNNLNADGVKKLSKLYREIASNTKFKEKEDSTTEPWTNVERTYAMQLLSVKLMSHPEIVSDHEWRGEQLKFLFNIGLCEVSNVGVELVPHFKESFYRALDNKLPKLDNLKSVLSSLITYVDESVFQNSELKPRTPLNDAAIEAWKKMVKLVKKLEKDSKNNENITVVFHIMDLHMGLQLFSDPEMAISSIDELYSCFEHLKSKKKSSKNKDSIVESDEPEWVEVVVDLMLSLLSRKSHLLRSLVGCVFSHICPHLTPSTIHQILAILDVKNGKNPLSSSKEGDESDSEMESNDEEENDDEDENSNDENNEEIEEESDSDIEESEVEDDTVTDRLRMAVRQALGGNTMPTDDEDIDVDNINEEEGKRLDESLAAAFKILKENRKSQTKKQEKSAQVLTHFRIRVIDLLEIYLETNPAMTMALDMLVPLFALLEFAIKDPHQKPLESRVRSCLKKLSAVKKFKNIEDVDEELLTTVLKALIEKGERSASICQEMGDKLAECCVFLVRCSQQTKISTDSFIQIFGENLTAFFKKRDCILPVILFKNLLQLCWIGNWHLAPLLVNFAFDRSIRSYRRGQALEFLKVFYSNIRMITADDHKDKRLAMERKLCESTIDVLLELSAAYETDNSKTATNVGKEIKQTYICHLFTLLFTVHHRHIPEAWDWKKIGESMANYRSHVALAPASKSAYNRLSNRIGAPVISLKKQALLKASLTNGNKDSESEKDSADEIETQNKSTADTPEKSSKNDKKKKKNSSKNKEKQKLKKETRELREKAMSEGLESLDFSSVNIPNGVSNEPMQNGNSEEAQKTEKVKNKRSNLNTSDVPSKKKKKIVQSGD